MQSWRNNPESEECQQAHLQNERELFALRMQALADSGAFDETDDDETSAMPNSENNPETYLARVTIEETQP